MRTVRCDKCGITYDLSDKETVANIQQKSIHVIVASARNNMNEPEQRVEESISVDLCSECQKELSTIYEAAVVNALIRIKGWIQGDDSDKSEVSL